MKSAGAFLAGPIKWWWEEGRWGGPEFLYYDAWRNAINDALVEAGYLCYRPWLAMKGNWDDRFQALNDLALQLSDVVIVMTPPGVVSQGTDGEMLYVKDFDPDKPIVFAPPPATQGEWEAALARLVSRLEAQGLLRDAVEQREVTGVLVLHRNFTDTLKINQFLQGHNGDDFRVHFQSPGGKPEVVESRYLHAEHGRIVFGPSGQKYRPLTVGLTDVRKVEALQPLVAA